MTRYHFTSPHLPRQMVCLALGLLWVGALAGCGSGDEASLSVRTPDAPHTLEEPDLYRIHGDTLYLATADGALTLLDLDVPKKPRILGAVALGGRARELAVSAGLAWVLTDLTCDSDRTQWTSCGVSQLVLVDVTNLSNPQIVDRRDLSGTPVASRLIDGKIMVVVSQEGSRSVVTSYARDGEVLMERARVRGVGSAKAAHITPRRIYLAGAGWLASQSRWDCSSGWCTEVPSDWGTGTSEPSWQQRTGVVQVIELDAGAGGLTLGGAVEVPGEPRGRFHLDAYQNYFRIVTEDQENRASVLSVIDVVEPSAPRVVGQVTMGYGEQLFATRFAKDRAYVVTFRQIDPLWIVDLSEPTAPRIISELEVPGWSEFIFPYGDMLLTVGRGDGGRGVAVSLFDVSDVERPKLDSRLVFGGSETSSEANVDHRALTVLEGDPKLIVLPLLSYDGGCLAQSRAQLIHLGLEADSGLTRGPSLLQQGRLQRSVLHRGSLLTISDRELVSSSGVGTRAISVDSRLGLPQGSTPQGDCLVDEYYHCSAGGPAGAPPLGLLVTLVLFGWLRRRQGRQARCVA